MLPQNYYPTSFCIHSPLPEPLFPLQIGDRSCVSCAFLMEGIAASAVLQPWSKGPAAHAASHIATLQCLILITGVADPFAVRGTGSQSQGPPSSSPGPAGGGAEPVRPIGDVNDWFRKLCQNASGVLYEDNYLQARQHMCFVFAHATDDDTLQ